MAISRLLSFFLLLAVSVSLFSCKPACPIYSCKVRMVHPHGTQEFRGRPFWKKQNPKMGEKLDPVSQEKAAKRNNKSRNKH